MIPISAVPGGPANATPRPRDRGARAVPWSGFLFILLGAVLAVAMAAQASHYRGGTLAWELTPHPNGHEVEFTGELAWRLPAPAPALGTLIFAGNLDFGDGSPWMWVFTRVDAIDVASEWYAGAIVDAAGNPIRHTYLTPNNGGLPWNAFYQSCCRIIASAVYDHIDNPSLAMRLEAPVDFAAQTGSPHVSGLPLSHLLRDCLRNSICIMPMTVVDPDGDPITYRHGTSFEATGGGGFVQPGPPNALFSTSWAGSSLMWITLLVTDAPPPEDLFSAHVVFEDGMSKTSLDFLIRFTVGLPPVVVPPIAPPPIPPIAPPPFPKPPPIPLCWELGLCDPCLDIGACNLLPGEGLPDIEGWGFGWEWRASDPSPDARFGGAVAVDGDVAVVGAPRDDALAEEAGSVVVFRRSAGEWVIDRQLVAPDGAAGDAFGTSVAVEGDTILVGAPNHDARSADEGAVYAFVRTPQGWALQQKLLRNVAVATADAGFGTALALQGGRLVVGAPGEAAGTSGAGSAYVFARGGPGWLQRARLTASDANTNDHFGTSVALDGDVIAVGAPAKSLGLGLEGGAVYVFRGQQIVWEEEAKLVPTLLAPRDRFGESVALSGSRLLVGAPADDGATLASGAAYTFIRAPNGWEPEARLVAPGASPLDRFGSSVALAGDLALVGAPGHDVNALDAGAVYVFVHAPAKWYLRSVVAATAPEASDEVGERVAIDRAGLTALVGAPLRDGGAMDAGAVFGVDLAAHGVGARGPHEERLDAGVAADAGPRRRAGGMS